MNGKSQSNKLNEVTSTRRGKEKSSIKVFPSQRNHWLSIPSYFICLDALCCCTQLENKALQNDFIRDLSFLISAWELHYVTRSIANSIPCQRGSRSAVLDRAPAVESRPCSAPRLVSGVWPHTQHQTAHLTGLLQPALLPAVPRGVCSIPPALGPGTPWLRRPRPAQSHLIPHQLPKLQQLVLLLPVCQQKAKSGEERTAGLRLKGKADKPAYVLVGEETKAA